VRAEAVARALDAHAYCSSSGWWNTRCPICGGDGKLGVKLDERGLGIHCHRGCVRSDIIAGLQRRGLLDEDGDVDADQRPEDPEQAHRRRIEQEAKRRARIVKAKDIWLSSVSAYATRQISNYLGGRGITIATPDTIRLHGMHGPYGFHHPSGERRPSMVALIEHVEHGIVGVSQTFLTITGSSKASFKKPRLFTGVVKGGAIRLGAEPPDSELVVGEGIESALSYMQMTGLNGSAALSATGVRGLVLPPEVRRVVIACDHDEDGVGWEAALAAARRWTCEGRQVRIAMPPDIGTDWNDVLLTRESYAA
jgi:hypothetical protein